MSGFPSIATDERTSRDVSNVPKSDSCTAANSVLFDHLVGAQQARFGNRQPDRLGCLEVDDKFELDWRSPGKLGWLLALENAIDIRGRTPKVIGRSTAQQAADFSEENGTDRRPGDDSEPPAM